MARTAFTLKFTSPTGEVTTVPVKPSTQIRLEEQIGVPIWERFRQGFSGSFDRLAFMVGQESKVIDADLTFDQFVDSDDVWVIDLVALDSTPIVDAEGND